MNIECSKSTLWEYNTETEVFQDMDKFELDEAKKFALSVKLQFPKFSKGFSPSDFQSFIEAHIGEKNVTAIGRLSFPNEWQLQVKSEEIRENLIRRGRVKINSRSCWISPLSQSEVRGFIHWLPNAISEETLRGTLEHYGEVMFIQVTKLDLWTKPDCDSRYFALNLKPGKTMDDIPHFFKINSHHGLITIRGRSPCCFHCRIVGHRKSECQKYREKLNSYCNRKPGSGAKRTKPRGRRFIPNLNLENPSAPATSKKKKRKKSKASKAQQTVTEEGSTSAGKVVENSGVKTEEKSVVGVQGAAEMSKVAQELVEKISRIQELNSLQQLTALQSELHSYASTLDKQIEEMQKKLSNTVITTETNDPQENKEQPTEEKKKKRKKKKKKKAAPEASNVASEEASNVASEEASNIVSEEAQNR